METKYRDDRHEVSTGSNIRDFIEELKRVSEQLSVEGWENLEPAVEQGEYEGAPCYFVIIGRRPETEAEARTRKTRESISQEGRRRQYEALKAEFEKGTGY